MKISLLAILKRKYYISVPCTHVAPTASSTFNQRSNGALMFATQEPITPMKTDSRIVTTAHPAVIPENIYVIKTSPYYTFYPFNLLAKNYHILKILTY